MTGWGSALRQVIPSRQGEESQTCPPRLRRGRPTAYFFVTFPSIIIVQVLPSAELSALNS